jgi:HEPN domain-containing protein
MKDETKQWLAYADENLASGRVLLEHALWNPCLQSCQQAVEKTLKALWIEHEIPFKKTHSIADLRNALAGLSIEAGLTDDDCDLLDSIYISSKYPTASALPDYAPDEEICRQCLAIAEQVRIAAQRILR